MAAIKALNDEIECHLEQETDKNVRLGMSRAEARRQALVQFGGLAQNGHLLGVVRESRRSSDGAQGGVSSA